MRNQHSTLLRHLYHISQTSTVEDYVQHFSDLVDQISAYDTHPDPLNYLTRFLDGLSPAVRVLVAVQQPPDLDTSYTMALLYEEMGEGSSSFDVITGYSPQSRRTTVLPPPPPPPPAKWISKSVESKHQTEGDRWSSPKNYRRAKGLCFTCGEKWGREHQCKPSIQLHVVQEMIDCMQDDDCETCAGETTPEQQ